MKAFDGVDRDADPRRSGPGDRRPGAGSADMGASDTGPCERGRALYVMLGGFLGAGKSTAMGQLGRFLDKRGMRVGLITNDQAASLVDTTNLRSQGFHVEEIAGGCFCCRFDSLVGAAQKLNEETRPDVFLAEPVGSCTDLVATVSYPLRRIYGDAYRIAPLSVLVDPVRAQRVFGIGQGKTFSPKVTYVYRKQIEEAHVVVINKCDKLDPAALRALRAKLEDEYPGKVYFEVSARDGVGLDAWFEYILREEMPASPALEIDYDTYAEGEALLGWLNATLSVSALDSFDANACLLEMATSLQARLRRLDCDIAHLKATFVPCASALNEIGVVNLVRSDFVPELGQQLSHVVRSGQVVVNLRAEGAPELLRRVLEEELQERPVASEMDVAVEHLECFRPGRPRPTHRMEPI